MKFTSRALSFQPKIRTFQVFETETNGTDIFWHISRKLEIIEFPKSDQLNRKFQEELKSNRREIPSKKFPKISICIARLSSFPEIRQNFMKWKGPHQVNVVTEFNTTKCIKQTFSADFVP